MLTHSEAPQRVEPTETGAAKRKRLRRRWVAIAILVVVAAVAAWLGFGAFGTTDSDSARGDSNAAPTPLAPPMSLGSGLGGYTATTFPAVGGPPDWIGVRDLAVAPDGMVWAATWDWSVAGFDGDTWTTYDYTTNNGLPGSAWTVEVAPDGTVWAAGQGDLARLDGETWITVPDSGDVGGFAFAPDGSVVAGLDDEVVRFDGDRWTTLPDPGIPPGQVLNPLDISPVDGSVWVGTGGWGQIGNVIRFDGSEWTIWPVAELAGGRAAGVPAATVAPDGSVWALLDDWTLARFDGDTETWEFFGQPTTVQGEIAVASPVPSRSSMAVGHDGTIWIARFDGLLFSFDGSSWTTDRLGDVLGPVEVGPDGSLWVGADASLWRYTPPAE